LSLLGLSQTFEVRSFIVGFAANFAKINQIIGRIASLLQLAQRKKIGLLCTLTLPVLVVDSKSKHLMMNLMINKTSRSFPQGTFLPAYSSWGKHVVEVCKFVAFFQLSPPYSSIFFNSKEIESYKNK